MQKITRNTIIFYIVFFRTSLLSEYTSIDLLAQLVVFANLILYPPIISTLACRPSIESIPFTSLQVQDFRHSYKTSHHFHSQWRQNDFVGSSPAVSPLRVQFFRRQFDCMQKCRHFSLPGSLQVRTGSSGIDKEIKWLSEQSPIISSANTCSWFNVCPCPSHLQEPEVSTMGFPLPCVV